MLEPTTRLHVWIMETDDEKEKRVKSILNDHDLYINQSHPPSDREIELQTQGFAETDENLSLVDTVENELQEEFSQREFSQSGGVLGDQWAIDNFESIMIEPNPDPDD